MKLSPVILNVLTGNMELRGKLAEEQGCDLRTIHRQMTENADNGKLTTYACVKILANETGLTEEQILIEETKKENAA